MRGRQVWRDPLALHSGDASQDTSPTYVALGRCGRRQHISSSTLKPGSPHHEDRRPSLLFPTSCVVPQVLAFLAFFLIAEMEKLCEEGGESQNSLLPSSHSAVVVQVRDWDMSLCPTQSRGQPAQPQLWCPPRPGGVMSSELFVLVSLGCWSPPSPSSSSSQKFQYPSVYLLFVSV